MLSPAYELTIDWDGDGGLLVADFESGTTDGWDPSASGTTEPVCAPSTVRAFSGSGSLLVTWSPWTSGSIQLVQPDPMGFVVGRQYTMSARVWVPASGGAHALCAVAGLALGSASTLTGQWQQISLTFTATLATHLLQIWVAGTPTGGEQTWIDYVRLLGPGENVGPGGLGRLPWSSAVEVTYGRDQARSLAPVAPGRLTGVTIDNVSRDYSPLNTGSPLAGHLGPGRAVALTATHDEHCYTLYRGVVDDYQVSADLADRSLTLSAVDGLAALKDQPVSTAVYPAARTGQAVHALLDAVGWTGPRDLDPGASTLRWWSAHGDAFDALQQLLAAEGLPALAGIGPTGAFVFRDRHHRLLRTASTTAQATYRDTGAQPWHDPPLTVDHGWRDVVNAVEVRVEEREPAMLHELVWSDPTPFTLAPGELRTTLVQVDQPVYDAVPPTWGVADPDIVTTTPTEVTATLSRTSGRSLTLTLRTAPTASPVVVTSVRLRALPVTVARTVTMTAEDPASIDQYGRRPHTVPTTWCNRQDAAAVAELVLAHRAHRRPVVTVTLVNANTVTLTEQLTRDLSDRVHLVDTESGLDHDAWIEQIRHHIDAGGIRHTTTFMCETVPDTPANLFRFDIAGAGFGDGVFGPSAHMESGSIFRFDVAGQGFGDGVFAA